MDRGRLITTVRRTVLLTLALTAATLGLHYALRDLDWRTFTLQSSSLDWRWLGIAVLFDISSYLIQGLRWRILLHSADVWHTTRAIYAGLFLNEMIPLRPGEAVRAWLAARDLRIRVWDVVPSMVAERLLDGLWLALALLGALWLAPLPAAVASGARVIAIICIGAIAVASCLGPLGSRLRRVASGLRNPRAVVLSGCFLLSQALAFWAVGRASHLSLTLLAAFVVMLIVRIGTMLPGAPANIGTHQFSTVLGLSLYGIAGTQAAMFSVVVFVVLTIPLCILGLAAAIASGVTWRGVRESLNGFGQNRISPAPVS